MKNILNSEYIQMYLLCKFFSKAQYTYIWPCVIFCIRASSTKRQTCSVHPICSRICMYYNKFMEQFIIHFLMSIQLHHKSKSISSKRAMAFHGIKIFITIKWNKWDVRCSFACLALF